MNSEAFDSQDNARYVCLVRFSFLILIGPFATLGP